MNLVPIKKAPSGLAERLRLMADKVDSGELTDLVAACVNGESYEFTYSASLSTCIVLSTLLQQNCIDRMRR